MDSATPSEPEAVPIAVPGQRPGDPAAPAAGAADPAPADPRPARTGRLRRILLVAVLVAGVVGAGAAGAGFLLYDQATRPDRSAPDVVVDNYLRAALRERDDTQARLYACDNQQALSEIQTFREDIEQREEAFATRISVTWGGLAVEPAGRNRATVTVRTSRTVAGGTESDSQTWRFDVLDADGWRVCGAARQD